MQAPSSATCLLRWAEGLRTHLRVMERPNESLLYNAVQMVGGLRASMTAQVSFGYGLFTGGFGLHQGIERLGAAVLPASSGNTPRQLVLLPDMRPGYLICTPSYALKLMDDILNGGLDRASIAIEHAHFGGEPWTEEMRSAKPFLPTRALPP